TAVGVEDVRPVLVHQDSGVVVVIEGVAAHRRPFVADDDAFVGPWFRWDPMTRMRPLRADPGFKSRQSFACRSATTACQVVRRPGPRGFRGAVTDAVRAARRAATNPRSRPRRRTAGADAPLRPTTA